MAEQERATPEAQVARLYEEFESQAARAGERLVGTGGFAAVLGQMAENAAALTRLSADAMDLLLRNLRLASRRDVVRLARQLARTEDKLERVLQELEEVHDQLRQAELDGGQANTRSRRTSTGAAPRTTTGSAPRTTTGSARRTTTGAARRATSRTRAATTRDGADSRRQDSPARRQRSSR